MIGKLKGMLPYAALLLGAAYLYHDAGRFAYAARQGELGPDFWPRAVLVLLMAVCAYEVVLRAFVASVAPPPEPAAEGGGPHGQPEEEAHYPWLLGAGIGITILYVLGLGILGFFLATTIYLAAFMLVGRYRRAGVIAATSVLGSLAFVYVFMKIVYVSLPLGVGPFEQVSVWILAALGIH